MLASNSHLSMRQAHRMDSARELPVGDLCTKGTLSASFPITLIHTLTHEAHFAELNPASPSGHGLHGTSSGKMSLLSLVPCLPSVHFDHGTYHNDNSITLCLTCVPLTIHRVYLFCSVFYPQHQALHLAHSRDFHKCMLKR